MATAATHSDPDGLNVAGSVSMFSFVRDGGMTAESFGPDFACYGQATTQATTVTNGDYQKMSITFLKVPKPLEAGN